MMNDEDLFYQTQLYWTKQSHPSATMFMYDFFDHYDYNREEECCDRLCIAAARKMCESSASSVWIITKGDADSYAIRDIGHVLVSAGSVDADVVSSEIIKINEPPGVWWFWTAVRLALSGYLPDMNFPTRGMLMTCVCAFDKHCDSDDVAKACEDVWEDLACRYDYRNRDRDPAWMSSSPVLGCFAMYHFQEFLCAYARTPEFEELFSRLLPSTKSPSQ